MEHFCLSFTTTTKKILPFLHPACTQPFFFWLGVCFSFFFLLLISYLAAKHPLPLVNQLRRRLSNSHPALRRRASWVLSRALSPFWQSVALFTEQPNILATPQTVSHALISAAVSSGFSPQTILHNTRRALLGLGF